MGKETTCFIVHCLVWIKIHIFIVTKQVARIKKSKKKKTVMKRRLKGKKDQKEQRFGNTVGTEVTLSSSYHIDVKHCFKEIQRNLLGNIFVWTTMVLFKSKIFAASTEIDCSYFCRENIKLNCCFSKVPRTSQFWLRMTRIWFIYMIPFSGIKQAKHKYSAAAAKDNELLEWWLPWARPPKVSLRLCYCGLVPKAENLNFMY